MLDETLLCAALSNTRSGHEAGLAIGVDPADFTEAARVVLSCAREQYGRDADQQKLSRAGIEMQLQRKYGAGAMLDSILAFVDSFPDDASGVNILEEYRLLRLSRVSTRLATLLATGQHGEETDEALALYARLRDGASDGGERVKLRLTADDFTEEDGVRLPLMPTTLNEYIGGGLLRGHNVTVFGRPDSGKSMFALNQSAYCIAKGFTVLYVANEEPDRDITRRLLARLLGTDIANLHSAEAMSAAIERAGEAYDRWNLLHQAGVTMRDVSRFATRVRPDLIVIDQLQNVRTGRSGDNRALQLDTLAREVRELGIKHQCVTMSVTQAGDSGNNQPILKMGDVDWSNTGIPAAADLMLGIGVDEALMAQNKRIISLPKNKINGRHGYTPVWVVPQQTAFTGKARA